MKKYITYFKELQELKVNHSTSFRVLQVQTNARSSYKW